MMNPSDTPPIDEPALRVVQVQTDSRCNGACVMCPWPSTRTRLAQGKMPWPLFTEVVDQVARHASVTLVSVMLQNEPLLDGRLAEAVAYVRRRMPRVGISIATNGELLDATTVRRLADAGLTKLVVSVNALRRDTFERVEPGLDYDRVMGNLRSLRESPPPGVDVLVKMLVVSENEAEMSDVEAMVDFVLPLRRGGITVALDPISNRAGSLERYAELLARPEGQSSHRRTYCADVFTHLNVLYDGRVLACCADWERRGVIGDLSRQSLHDVWTGPEAQRRRAAVLAAEYDSLSPCRTCSQAANIVANLRRRAAMVEDGASPAERR